MKETKFDERTQIEFDPQEFLAQFQGALSLMDKATELGSSLASQSIKRIFFVGCGAPHFMMRVLAYWARQSAVSLEIRNYFPAEFIHQAPLALDQDTVVILGSHSGKTAETVAAADFLTKKPCTTIAITQGESSPLGSKAGHVLAYGQTQQGYFSSYLLGQALISAILESIEPDWSLHNKILSALPLLPQALAEAKTASLEHAVVQAHQFSKDRLLYVIGGGPMFTTAYTFATCFLMEMQRMHAHPLVAAEFFHGPFEVVDKTTPMLILVGEDPSRPEAERVVRFCQQYAQHFMVYDSKQYPMTGIPAEIRPIFAPFVVDAALTSLVEAFAVVRQHPLTLRRYMGKVDY